MKKKDIIVLIISIVVIGVAVFFMLRILSPKADESAVNNESNSIPNVPTNIDETTYKNIENLSDYGGANLDGIGKSDIFAGF